MVFTVKLGAWGEEMLWSLLFILVICIIGLVATILVVQKDSSEYSNRKSMKGLTIFYIILTPLLIAVFAIAWFMV